MKLLLVLLASGGLSGCSTRLPNIKATEIHQTTSFPGFASTIDATGISITDTYIKATDDATTSAAPAATAGGQPNAGAGLFFL